MPLTFTNLAQIAPQVSWTNETSLSQSKNIFSSVKTDKYQELISLSSVVGKVANEAYTQLKSQSEFIQQSEEKSLADDQDQYWGVQQTSSRIVDFVLGIADDDKEKFTLITDAIRKGFQDAETAFGGSLPKTSYSTYEAVFTQLDSWAAEAVNPKEKV